MDAPSNVTVDAHGGIVATGLAGVMTYRYVMLRRALKSEVERPEMPKMIRGSIVNALRAEGITTKRNKRGAYLDLNATMVAAGYDDLPLKV
jgi:hypothetical protein